MYAVRSYAQMPSISLEVEDERIISVLDKIEKQSEFRFFYNNKLVDTDRKVSLHAANLSVIAVLKKLFAESDIGFEVVDKDIILTNKDAPVKGNKIIRKRSIDRQKELDKIIKGLITDESGNPVAGANITLKGTATESTSDQDGSYAVKVTQDNAILVFSMVGFVSQEVTVASQSTIDIVLKEDVKLMEEVVVVGYGTVKKASLGGAVGTVDAKAFQSRPVNNAAEALQGQVPGLTIVRSGGAPGSKPTIRIRDVSSINGGQPLVLIDGVEGDLNTLNPADIDNISVLKDGSAAIYGARASDGVLLITTKGGRRNQKLRITADASNSINTAARVRKPTSLYQHAAMGLEITDGSFPLEYKREELDLILAGDERVLTDVSWGRWSDYPKFYKNQDWNDMMIGKGRIQSYNLGFSGGGEKHAYLLSLGNQQETGILKYGNDSDKRYFVRAKTNIEIAKGLDYDLNISYDATSRYYSSAINEGQKVWDLIYLTRRWAPMHNPAGNYYTFEGFDNPAQVLEEGGDSKLISGNFTVNNQLRWQIMDGLNLIGRAAIRKYDTDQDIVQKKIYSYNWENVNHRTARNPNTAERNYSKTLSKNFTLYGEYKKEFGLHDVGLMAGGSHESADTDYFSALRRNFDQQDNMSLQLGSSDNQDTWSEGNAWTINSFFSRVNYAFAGKYLIEGTLRADGSSRFHPDKRWGWYPGANLAWRLGEEKWIKSWNVFDELKLRASYGEMGNQSGIGYYDYIQTVGVVLNDDGVAQYYPIHDGNKGIMYDVRKLISLSRTWETIKTKNIGLDLALLQNRLYGSFDYFWKDNKNMLVPVTYPGSLGVEAPRTNDGHLEVHGWELSLGWRDQAGTLSYSVRGNISDSQNKVISRVGSNIIRDDIINPTPTGYPLNSYFGYAFDGIIQNEQELVEYEARFPNGGIPGHGILSVGDAKYKDLDGDGLLSVHGDGKEGSGDVLYLGNTNPRYTFGLNLSMEFKGFDFSAFVQGVGKRTLFLEGEANKPFSQPWFQSAEFWYGKTWTPERPDAQFPAVTLQDKRNYNYRYSTNTRNSAAYMRMKNLQLGYTIPKSMVSKMHLEKLRVFFSGEDLFEITKLPNGWDPEDSGNVSGYPFVRNFSFGVNLVF